MILQWISEAYKCAETGQKGAFISDSLDEMRVRFCVYSWALLRFCFFGFGNCVMMNLTFI